MFARDIILYRLLGFIWVIFGLGKLFYFISCVEEGVVGTGVIFLERERFIRRIFFIFRFGLFL